jgi:hypothetical protein
MSWPAYAVAYEYTSVSAVTPITLRLIPLTYAPLTHVYGRTVVPRLPTYVSGATAPLRWFSRFTLRPYTATSAVRAVVIGRWYCPRWAVNGVYPTVTRVDTHGAISRCAVRGVRSTERPARYPAGRSVRGVRFTFTSDTHSELKSIPQF